MKNLLVMILPRYFGQLFRVSLDVCFVFGCKAAKTAAVKFAPVRNVFWFGYIKYAFSRSRRFTFICKVSVPCVSATPSLRNTDASITPGMGISFPDCKRLSNFRDKINS